VSDRWAARHWVDRFNALGAAHRAMLWGAASGLLFTILNAVARSMSQAVHPTEAQFLRYVFGLAVMLPFVFRAGVRAYIPSSISGQFWRGAVHTLGLVLWFLALPHLPIADTTAIGFTTPIFIMIGAALMLGEKMRWERWVAAVIGFVGVLIVVGPKLVGSGGWWTLVMVMSMPVFAVSFLMTKVLTRNDSPEVIVVWQAVTVSLLSLPLALAHWTTPTTGQLGWFLLTGILGSCGHYCLTHALSAAEVSTTQTLKFLELIWASLLGYLVFSDAPSGATILGGGVILIATVWIARLEARWGADAEP
jgi:drug/metabolite transporter (DMT)-like permease